MIFDWRGTLVSNLLERQWVQEALLLLGREADTQTVEDALAAIVVADGPQHRLDAPGMDTDAALRRPSSTYSVTAVSTSNLSGPSTQSNRTLRTTPSPRTSSPPSRPCTKRICGWLC